VLIARAPEGLNELISALNRVRELLPVDFEPSYVTMVPNTESPKPQTAHRALSRRDLSQLRDSNGIAVRKAGRQTGHGRLVPSS
jgi:hypothetical protein